MTEEVEVAPEATEEAVQPKSEKVEASEATKSTEGQDNDPPAEGEETPEEISPAKARRERRKAENARLRQEAAEAEAKLRQTQERLAKAQEAAKSNTPPKEADYADYNEYLVAMGAFHAARQMDARQSRELEEATQTQRAEIERLRQEERQQIAAAWAAQVDDAKGRYADFEKVAFTAPISDELAEIIASADMGADVAYYLGQNRELARQLSNASPIEQAMAIGRIEARLSLPKPNTQPKAPDPINPVRPSATGTKPVSKMTMAEYKAARAAGKI